MMMKRVCGVDGFDTGDTVGTVSTIDTVNAVIDVDATPGEPSGSFLRPVNPDILQASAPQADHVLSEEGDEAGQHQEQGHQPTGQGDQPQPQGQQPSG